jgi:hypothetical protein
MGTNDVSPSSKGWGFAALIVALAASLWATAYVIHTKTFCHPMDPECAAVGAPPAAAPAGH